MPTTMQLFHAPHLTDLTAPTIVTVGSFDGVHRGHQHLLQRLVGTARREGLQSVVLTFAPHPRIVLGRGEGLQQLTTEAEKAAWLGHYGVDAMVVWPFTRDFAALSGEEFVRDILQAQLHARVLVAGYNHHFGHDRLAAASLQVEQLRVELVDRYDVEGRHVSSTEIRRHLAAGEWAQAEELLGHPIQLTQR